MYAGVRLRCLLPVAALRRAGHDTCATYCADNDLQQTDVVVVQAKWLLDAESADGLVRKASQLRSLKESGTRLFLDSFDNYFLNDCNDPKREDLLHAYRKVLDLFERYIVSSPGLVPYLREHLGPHAEIEVIGDPLEGPGANEFYETAVIRWNPKRWLSHLRLRQRLNEMRIRRHRERQLMWFGNHGSAYSTGGMAELGALLPRLQEASSKVPLRLTVVSNSREKFETLTGACKFPCDYLEWDRLSFAYLLQEQDLVVLPSRVTAFTAGKSNNRLLLPLSLGVPVMASGLPDYLPWRAYCAIDEWDQLESNLQDLGPLRQRLARLEPSELAKYSLAAIGREWVAALQR